MPNYWIENTSEPLRFLKCLWMPDSDTGKGAGWQYPHEMRVGDIVIHHFSSNTREIKHGFNGYSKIKEKLLSIDKRELLKILNELTGKENIKDEERLLGRYKNFNSFHLIHLNEIVKFDQPIKTKNVSEKIGNLPDFEKKVFDVNGNIVQMYLRKINEKFYTKMLSLSGKRKGEKSMNDLDNQIKQIQKYITAKGFYFTQKDIANFYLSLKTKPFVILAGISGTGKTKLVELFAEAIGAKCELIPVKPDWTDNSDLMGFTNLQGEFQEKEIVRIIKKANDQPEQIFIALLDEMNLARVEHYFSDFLSIIESRRRDDDGKIITNNIIKESELGKNRKELSGLIIPDNLYMVGTVNMDETTHPFSRKVLDRANSIELNKVELDWIEHDNKQTDRLNDIKNEFLRSKYLNSKDLSLENKETLKETLKKLKDINNILEKADLHFGYRVRDEFCFYMLNQKELNGIISEEDALDYQVMQKILPRIQGSASRINDVLIDLLSYLTGKKDIEKNSDVENITEQVSEIKKFNRSKDKILFMLRRYRDDGFTSFWL